MVVSVNAANVAKSMNHSLFVGKDGTVWAAGANNYGQIGNGTVQELNEFIPVFELNNSAPSEPTNVAVSEITNSTIRLLWSPSVDNAGIGYYEVYDGSTLISTTPNSEPGIVIDNLTSNTYYHLTVKAVDISGNSSASSAIVDVLTKPNAPANATVTETTATTVSLKWEAPEIHEGIAGYVIYSGDIIIGTTTATSFTATELESEQSYDFYIKAKDVADQLSDVSNTVNATTESGWVEPDPQGNLLLNSGFEHVITGNPPSWNKYISSAASGGVTSITSPVNGGSKAVQLAASGLPAWDNAHISQRFEVTGGGYYRLTGYLQAAALEHAFGQLQVQFNDANDQYITHDAAKIENVTSDYLMLELNKAIPANAKYAYVTVQLVANDANGSGTLYVDDVKFEYASEAEMLTNGGMESGLDGVIPGWGKSLEAPTGGIVSVTSPVNGGSRAVQMTADGMDIWNRAYMTQRMDVIGGSSYRLSGQFQVDALERALAELTIRFFDANNQYISDYLISINEVTNGYALLEQNRVVPANAAYAEVMVSLVANEANGSGTIYVDDVKFEYVTDAALLVNGGMESATANGPIGWNKYVSSAASGGVTSITSPVNGGSKAVQLAASGLPAWDNANISQRFEVTGGGYYRLTGYLQAVALDHAFGQLQVQFNDANDQYITNYITDVENVTSGYLMLEQNKAIPENAKYAYVTVQLVANDANGSGTLYVDDVKFEYASEAALLTNGGMESGLDGVIPGWRTHVSELATGSVTSVTSSVYGNKGVMISASGLPAWDNANLSQRVEVTGGVNYRLTGYLHAVELDHAYGQMHILFTDVNDQYISHYSTDLTSVTNGYEILQNTNAVPGNAKYAYITIYLVANEAGGSGTLYADEVRLELLVE